MGGGSELWNGDVRAWGGGSFLPCLRFALEWPRSSIQDSTETRGKSDSMTVTLDTSTGIAMVPSKAVSKRGRLLMEPSHFC